MYIIRTILFHQIIAQKKKKHIFSTLISVQKILNSVLKTEMSLIFMIMLRCYDSINIYCMRKYNKLVTKIKNYCATNHFF